MKSTRADNRQYIAGYALGTGLTFLPLVGIPLRFAFLEVPAPLVYAAAFALGLLMGALGAWWRRRDGRTPS